MDSSDTISLFFIVGGLTVVYSPIGALAPKMSFVLYYSPIAVKLIGLSEVLGAIGLILPGLLRIKPILVPLSAFMLLIVMILAVIYHLNHNEAAGSGFPAFLGILSAIAAWGRYKVAPLLPKGNVNGANKLKAY